MPNEAPKCQHLKTNGTQCGSPALKNNQFCYYHHHCRPVTFNYGLSSHNYSPVDITLPVFDDAHSIQLTLHRVTELLLRHQISQKDASLVLYALQLAMFNLKRLELNQPKPEEVVTDRAVEPPAETDEQREARERAELAKFEATLIKHPNPRWRHSIDEQRESLRKTGHLIDETPKGPRRMPLSKEEERELLRNAGYVVDDETPASGPKPEKNSEEEDLPPGDIHACVGIAESSFSTSALSPNARLRRGRVGRGKTRGLPDPSLVLASQARLQTARDDKGQRHTRSDFRGRTP